MKKLLIVLSCSLIAATSYAATTVTEVTSGKIVQLNLIMEC